MADRTDGSSNTAIVAIVVLILVGIVVFLFFFRPSGTPQQEDGPDIELEVNPPDNGGGGGAVADTSGVL